MILKFIWKFEQPGVANPISKNKLGRLELSELKTYYQAIAIRQCDIKE
jgi:hypothetical protein